MAGTFPNLGWGSCTLYPVTCDLNAGVTIKKFGDGSEQRYRNSPFLNDWQVRLEGLKYADEQSIEAFWQTQKGDFDSSWTWPLDGVSYTNSVFTDPTFPDVEVSEGIHSLTLNIRQTQQSGTYATGAVTTFPALSTGATVQLPFQRSQRFQNQKNVLPTGLQVARYLWSSPLNSWTMQYSLVTNADAGMFFDLYAKCLGPYRTFSFVDPDTGVTHPKVRFGPQPIRRVYTGMNRNQVSFLLEEIR